jgi:hypothetical protein
MAFKEAELADHPGVLRVVIYNPEENEVHRVLGLTQERLDALIEITKESRDKSGSIAECLAMMSKRIDNANELAYLMLNFGANLAKSGEAKKASSAATAMEGNSEKKV